MLLLIMSLNKYIPGQIADNNINKLNTLKL